MASISTQVLALLKRNILIKRRKLKVTMFEFLLPIYFAGILAAVKLGVNPDRKPEVSQPPCWDQSTAPPISNRSILFAPNNSLLVQEIMRSVAMSTNCSEVGFANASELQMYYAQSTDRVVGGIVFNNVTDGQVPTTYDIRFDSDKTNIPKTSKTFLANNGFCREPEKHIHNSFLCPTASFISSGFMHLQSRVDAAILKMSANSSNFTEPDTKWCFMPKASYLPSSEELQTLSAIYLVIAYSPMVSILLSLLVTEKEKKIKIGMKMMGMSDVALWLSWAITYAFIILVSTSLIIIISLAAKLFDPSDLGLVFLMLYMYGLSVMTFAFMLVPFFSKASVASAIGSLSTISFSLFYLLVTRVETSIGVKWFLCLLSPTALGLGLGEVVHLNSVGTGLTMANIATAENVFPVRGAFIMLLVDTVLYLLLAMYFDRVIPDEFGKSWSPIFFLKPSFFRSIFTRRQGFAVLDSSAGGDHAVSYGTINDRVAVTSQRELVPPLPADDNVEEVPSSMKNKEAIQIRNLRKVYRKSRLAKIFSFSSSEPDVVACDDVSLNAYEGEITALLGHNGAGKSTLISLLTGMVTATAGVAKVYGLDVDSPADMSSIRKFTGICPQHDILYDELTVEEHLLLFARLKGIPADRERAEVEKIISDITLSEKTHSRSSTLSGGQKRKLSVGIALIGNPKIVFLDEPTSGMDPLSRRQLWGLLKKSRQNKIIFLTTHFMDEADILADRKAILSKGLVQCAGSSVFLKSRFGIGYNLSMVTTGSCQTEEVRALVQGKVAGASKGRAHGKELSFRLPLDQSKTFPDLFHALEEETTGKPLSEQLGIQSYGISMTTLEEVFLRLGDHEAVDRDEEASNPTTQARVDLEELTSPVEVRKPAGLARRPSAMGLVRDKTADSDDSEDEGDGEGAGVMTTLSSEGVNSVTDPKQLVWQQFKTLFWLRMLLNVRNSKSFFATVIVPPIMIIVGLVLAKQVNFSSKTQSSLLLQPSTYFDNTRPCLGVETGSTRLLFSDNSSSMASPLLPYFPSVGYNSCVVPASADLYQYIIANRSHHGTIVDNDQTKLAMGNTTATFSLPVVFNVLSSAMLQMVTNNLSKSIETTVVPLPPRSPKLDINSGLYVSLFIIALGLANILSAFIQDVVEDKEIRARHQLQVSGVANEIYWLNFFTVQFSIYMIELVLVLIIVAAVQVDSLTTGGAIFCILVSFIIYATLMVLFGFLFSHVFSKRSTVESTMSTILIFMVLIPYFSVSIIDQLNYTTTARGIHYGLCAIDIPYCFSGILYYVDRVYRIKQLGFGNAGISDYFAWEANVSGSLLLMLGQIAVLLFFLWRTETRHGRKALKVTVGRHDQVEKLDNDVRDEVHRTLEYSPDPDNEEDCLVMRNLRKEFQTSSNTCVPKAERKPKKIAVNGLCLGVRQGEVLGFLGPNGAGKTTTMNMVTGNTVPDEGEVFLEGYPLLGRAGRQQALGYCPQADAVWKELTLEEHMQIYALVKGVSPNALQPLINKYIDTMAIRDHVKKRSKQLSGGTKRKLSFAMSLLGTTRIVLLDEPSTGLDPGAKRFLWNVISKSISGKRAAVLTTHSMEEADALCSRVGIIVNGRLMCLGSTQHLKTKHGGHYQLELKLSTEEEGNLTERMKAVREYVQGAFAGTEVLEEFNERALYKIPHQVLNRLSEAFTVLEAAKDKFAIEEYSLSQASLEQVFINFAKQQGDTA